MDGVFHRKYSSFCSICDGEYVNEWQYWRIWSLPSSSVEKRWNHPRRLSNKNSNVFADEHSVHVGAEKLAGGDVAMGRLDARSERWDLWFVLKKSIENEWGACKHKARTKHRSKIGGRCWIIRRCQFHIWIYKWISLHWHLNSFEKKQSFYYFHRFPKREFCYRTMSANYLPLSTHSSSLYHCELDYDYHP